MSELAGTNYFNDNDQLAVSTILIGLGAEEYIDNFKKRKIDHTALTQLTDDDLKSIGIASSEIRMQILKEIKNLPLYDESNVLCESSQFERNLLDPMDVVDVLKESSTQLKRIKLSLMTNKLSIIKDKHVTDCLLLMDKYASDIALDVLTNMKTLLNDMDSVLTQNIELKSTFQKKNKKKKLIIGVIGSSCIVLLAAALIQTLKKL